MLTTLGGAVPRSSILAPAGVAASAGAEVNRPGDSAESPDAFDQQLETALAGEAATGGDTAAPVRAKAGARNDDDRPDEGEETSDEPPVVPCVIPWPLTATRDITPAPAVGAGGVGADGVPADPTDATAPTFAPPPEAGADETPMASSDPTDTKLEGVSADGMLTDQAIPSGVAGKLRTAADDRLIETASTGTEQGKAASDAASPDRATALGGPEKSRTPEGPRPNETALANTAQADTESGRIAREAPSPERPTPHGTIGKSPTSEGDRSNETAPTDTKSSDVLTAGKSRKPESHRLSEPTSAARRSITDRPASTPAQVEALEASQGQANADERRSGQQAVSVKSEIRPEGAPAPAGPAAVQTQPNPAGVAAQFGRALATAEAGAAAPARVDAPAELPDPELADRLVQSLRMQALRGGGDAIVQIRPEHLGPVTVSLRVEHGTVSAHIMAADPKVVGWLQAHQGVLRDGLQANGLTLNRLVVDQDGRNPDRRDRRRETPARPRFERPEDRHSTFELTL